MRIFVTGGSGFVGGHLIEHLKVKGHEVYAMARSPLSAGRVLERGGEPVPTDLESITAQHLEGYDAVIHSAARAEDWGTRKQFWDANVEGTRSILKAAREAGVPRFVFVGTEALIFTGQDLVDADESVPYPERHRYLYSETKAEAEKLVLAANQPGEFETISVRPRFVWGPRDTSVLPTLLKMHRAGTFAWIDGGRVLTSTTHVFNVVHALELALTGGTPGNAYFVVDDGVRTIRSFLTALVKAAAREDLGSRNMPSWVARPLARVVEFLWKWLPLPSPPPMTPFAIDMLSSTVTICDDRARKELNYEPVISVEEGLAALSDAVREL